MRIVPILCAAASIAACSQPGEQANAANQVAADACHELAAADKAALRKLDQNYAAAWLMEGTEAQSEALMALFRDDATIIPGQGNEPMQGSGALRGFWFPDDSAPTVVTEFERATSSIEGTNCLAAVTGRSQVTWEFEGETTRQVGNYMLLAKQGPAGGWKIVRMIWNNRTLDDASS